MRRTSLILSFLLASGLNFFSPLFFPQYRLLAFAPFLAFCINRFSFLFLLWLSIFSGLAADIASLHFRFGISSFCYVTTLLLFFPVRRQFFEEKPIPFCLLTYLISCIVTFQLSLVSLYKKTICFSSFPIFLREIFFSSLFDTFAGFLFIFIPLKLYAGIRERGIKQMLFKKSE